MKKTLSITNVIYVIGLLGAVVHLVDALFGIFPVMQLRPLFLMFVLVLTILIDVKKSNSIYKKVWNYFLLTASVVSTGFLIVNFEKITRLVGYIIPEVVVMGVILIVVLVYSTWRRLGKVLPIVVIVFLIYASMGQFLPPPLGHSGLQFKRMITFLYTTGNGIFGVSIGVCSRILVFFIIFAEFLKKCGANKLFFAVAFSLTKRTRGGAAKSSVIASALFGTIAGSPIANVMVTGTFTIPMMKKVGYPGYVAAGVEAAASSGGLIMPPIMGAGAFIMADTLGLPYEKIMLAAIIPSLLYYLSIFLAVDIHAIKNINVLKTVDFDGSEQEIPIDVKTYIHSIIPLVIFLVQVFLGFSLTRSVIISIFICPFVSWLRKETRMSFKDILDALSDGFRNTISLGITTASAGIIVGVIALSGLGFSFVSLLGMFSNHSFIALLITAVLCLVVGMGMPAVAAYVIVATLAVPFFVKIGFMPLAIHFFIFFYSAFATITPPVALGTYAAASLAEADMWKSGIQGFKLASVGFIIPFMFAYSNQLLGQVVHLKEMIIILPTAIFGVLLYVSGLQGYLYFYGQIKHLIFRILFVIFGALLILPDTKMNIVILAIVLVFMIFNKIRPRFKKNVDKLN